MCAQQEQTEHTAVQHVHMETSMCHNVLTQHGMFRAHSLVAGKFGQYVQPEVQALNNQLIKICIFIYTYAIDFFLPLLVSMITN